ncbi:glycosyltransferase family 4 protein [Paenibacillus lemnae]|uniref:Glycosyltransferase family 4 protein n=1 Tax=Paenibacillus lemnae TaxID=1330551 RepID=A0A848M7N7_PAELE|nr:glycosyltransferase family 4 protein [Paenibacillus lemnae]NMO95873.1 glycosyltransferase family 4 protein [Paenibacillus lemnae]
MRILLATMWLVPHVGGVWNFMQQLQNRLTYMGHTVDLLGNSPDYGKFHIVNRGQELPKELLLPMLNAKLNAGSSPMVTSEEILQFYEFERYCLELSAAFFGLDQYDIIHTQDIFAARSLGRVKPKHVPLISHVHGSVAKEMHDHFLSHPEKGILPGSPTWRYFPEVEYQAGMSADLTIAANQWSKNMLVGEYGVSDHQVTVFPYGMETGTFYAKMLAGTPTKRPAGKKVIICAARLVAVKGIDVLLTALSMLKQMRNDWVCWIVGDGEMRDALQELTVSLALQQEVFFHGTRNDVPGMLNESDIFVHTCIQDNQPYSVMEAQLAGLPSVVSNAGGLPEMVQHGVTGLVSSVGDACSVAQHLYLLLDDDEYRLTLGRNAQAFANSYWSMDLMIDRLMAIYNQAITQKSHLKG